MKTFLKFLGKLALVLAALAVAGALFLYSGAYDVSAASGHTKLVGQGLNAVMMRSVHAHAHSIPVPKGINLQSAALAESAANGYEMMCRTCHGAPGKKPDPWKFYPPAPDLADALRAKQWSDSEIFWIIKHGIKDTAMSAFGGSHEGAHSDEDIWALTALVRQFSTLTATRSQTDLRPRR